MHVSYDPVVVLDNTSVQYTIDAVEYDDLYVNTSNTTAVLDLNKIAEEVDTSNPINISVCAYNDAGHGESAYCTVWYPQGERGREEEINDDFFSHSSLCI